MISNDSMIHIKSFCLRKINNHLFICFPLKNVYSFSIFSIEIIFVFVSFLMTFSMTILTNPINQKLYIYFNYVSVQFLRLTNARVFTSVGANIIANGFSAARPMLTRNWFWLTRSSERTESTDTVITCTTTTRHILKGNSGK